jgi:uncharacterized protein YndB with AHSA1/START domain
MIVCERIVEAPVETLWPLVDDVSKLSDWFTVAESMEVIEGEGKGRRQRLHGRWGKKAAEIDQLVTAYEPPFLLAWEHEAERLDGKPAPRFARSTLFEIRLIPRPQGALVRLRSVQEPAGVLKGVGIRLFGKREVAKHMERSLEGLAARFRGGSTHPRPR